MLSQLALIVRDPTLRMIALCMLLFGTINASLLPYQSLVAITRIGLSPGLFAGLLVLISVTAVSAALSAGIVTDQRANRRRVALLSAAAAVVGPVAMLIAPGAGALVLCHALMLPVMASLYGQFFALARLATTGREAMRDAVLGTLRAGLSLIFVVVLTLWAAVFAAGVDVMAIYAVASVAGLLLLTLIWRAWPRDGQTDWQDPPSGLSLRQSLGAIAQGRVLSRLVMLGAITSTPALYVTLISLVFASVPGRGPSDVALFVGMVAGWEVPFMLALPLVTRHLPPAPLIAAGGVIYAAYLVALPWLAPSAALWVLPLVAGFGGAAILTLPISYFQGLMQGLPGIGSSLLSVQKVVADTFCALAFALGTGFGTYETAAILGACIACTGCAALFLADRRLSAS